MASEPLGLLGGTFDPVHYAHLRLAEEALERLPVARVRWIPSGRPGHRGAPAAGAAGRVAMLRLAVEGNPRFALDEADAYSAHPVYTVSTLSRLRSELGSEVPLVLVIGADQLQALDSWREWRRLFELAHIAVAERPGYPAAKDLLAQEVAEEFERRECAAADLASCAAGRMTRFTMTPLDISASAIRTAIARGMSVRYLLPEAVLDYIASHGLYTQEKSTR